VTFRLSPEEYEVLWQACISAGARSVSAFARDAVMRWAHIPDGSGVSLPSDLTTLKIWLEELDCALEKLDCALKDVRQKISQVCGPQPSETSSPS
jgi:hypothetical protein